MEKVASLRTSPLDGLYDEGCVVGTLVAVTEAGTPLVQLPGSDTAQPAQILSGATDSLPRDQSEFPVPVLLAITGNKRELPIVVGRLQPSVQKTLPARHEVLVDGKRLVFEAEREIVLRCGKGSITITSDGKITIKGIDLTSRAARVNKIKGASVNIN
jgi:uncharacterized protein DUF6484